MDRLGKWLSSRRRAAVRDDGEVPAQ
jgi:hypothetical protein